MSARTSESKFKLRRDYAKTQDSAIGKAKGAESRNIFPLRKATPKSDHVASRRLATLIPPHTQTTRRKLLQHIRVKGSKIR